MIENIDSSPGGRGQDIRTPDGARRQMLEVALRRLDSSADVLKLIYVDNDSAPQELRDIFAKYLAGALSRADAENELRALHSQLGLEAPSPDSLQVFESSFGDQSQAPAAERRTLEEQVLDALRANRALELVRFFEDPEVREVLKEVAISSAFGLIALHEDEPLEAEEQDELRREIAESVEGLFSDPRQTMVCAVEQAVREFQTRKQFEEQFDRQLFTVLELDGGSELNDEIISEFRVLNASLLKFREPHERLLALIVEDAEREGIEAATTREKINRAIREVHPTAEEFETQLRDAELALFDYVDKVEQLFSRGGENLQKLGKFMSTTTRQLYTLTEKLRVKELPERLRAIYG
ncbi:MAG: hypothetical protein KDD64_05675 [Bdellovibrionales bacterium]|nr:hypothetical protein [Bdellovibrionales bacterium]